MAKNSVEESLLDMIVADLKKSFPDFIIYYGKEANSFSIWADRFQFSSDAWGLFTEMISDFHASYSIVCNKNGVEITVSNYGKALRNAK